MEHVEEKKKSNEIYWKMKRKGFLKNSRILKNGELRIGKWNMKDIKDISFLYLNLR